MTKIFEEIQGAVNVRQHFAQYLDRTFKGSIRIETFKALHEVQQIGIFYHFITKLNIIILVKDNLYEIYFSLKATADKDILKDLKSQEIMEIVEEGRYIGGPQDGEFNGIYYIKIKEYEGSVFVGFREAILETIKYLNETKWMKYHPVV